MGTAEKEMRRVKRYMIYMPASGPDRLIPCGEGGSLALSEMETLFYAYRDREVLVGDVLLCAKVDGELIGFALPVARTICEEFGIDVDVEENI